MITIVTFPGREVCKRCGGDPGTPCEDCGGAGVLPFKLPPCPVQVTLYRDVDCNSELEREGWHELPGTTERLPRYACRDHGHEVAIRFTPVEERDAA